MIGPMLDLEHLTAGQSARVRDVLHAAEVLAHLGLTDYQA